MWASFCVLLHADGLRGNALRRNGTVASATTSRNSTIDVFLRCPLRPLLPTVLFASAPGIDFTKYPPKIVRAVEDLILLRVPVPVGRRLEEEYEYDYYIYRVGSEKKGPSSSLKLLPRAPIFFCDEDVGLLRRGEEHYTIAALMPSESGEQDVYDLHRFDSVTEKWSTDKVALVEPQNPFPCKKIPRDSQRILFHLTTTVIPIGGTMLGWVDLWRGILLCDVLTSEPELRGVPLPLPLGHLTCNGGHGTHLGCPKSLRAITVIDDKPGVQPSLKFVHLEVDAVPIPDDDNEEEEDWEMHDWKITTWSNNKMTTSYDDWLLDFEEVKASCTSISSKLNSKMLEIGLLSSPGPGGTEPQRAFQNLLVSSPTLGMNGGVVFLQARVKFPDTKVFVLALETKGNKLLGAVEFATERIRGAGVEFFPTNIGKYIDIDDRIIIPFPRGDSTWKELTKSEGTVSQKIPRVKFSFLGRLQHPIPRKVSLNDDDAGKVSLNDGVDAGKVSLNDDVDAGKVSLNDAAGKF